MFDFKSSASKSKLDEVIDNVFSEMAGESSDSEEYAKMVDQLTKLYALRDTQNPKRISPDTLAIVLGNLLGIVIIVGHERAHVVTSRALSFIMKLK